MRLLKKTFGRRRVNGPTMSAEEAAFCSYVHNCVLPSPTDTFDRYVPSRWIGNDGIELSVSEQLARWKGGATTGISNCIAACANEQINVPFAGENYLGTQCLHNGWYPTPDAEIYASMICDLLPDQIVEVGSGYSTLIAREALSYAAHKAPLCVIDPQPRTDVERAADQVVYERVEARGLDKFKLTERSLLFIDSSHVTRARGDVPYLFCEVLPRLPSGAVVHVHDIFIPYDYPTCYDRTCWTEQYVLQALLAHSPRYKTLFATQYMSRRHSAEMQATFGPVVGADNLFYGASYWIQIR